MKYPGVEEAWVLEKLSSMDYMIGYPQSEGSLRACVRAYMRIIHTNEEIEHGSFPGGRVRPGDWLFDLLVDKYDRFPAPAVARREYTVYFPPFKGEDVNS